MPYHYQSPLKKKSNALAKGLMAYFAGGAGAEANPYFGMEPGAVPYTDASFDAFKHDASKAFVPSGRDFLGQSSREANRLNTDLASKNIHAKYLDELAREFLPYQTGIDIDATNQKNINLANLSKLTEADRYKLEGDRAFDVNYGQFMGAPLEARQHFYPGLGENMSPAQYPHEIGRIISSNPEVAAKGFAGAVPGMLQTRNLTDLMASLEGQRMMTRSSQALLEEPYIAELVKGRVQLGNTMFQTPNLAGNPLNVNVYQGADRGVNRRSIEKTDLLGGKTTEEVLEPYNYEASIQNRDYNAVTPAEVAKVRGKDDGFRFFNQPGVSEAAPPVVASKPVTNIKPVVDSKPAVPTRYESATQDMGVIPQLGGEIAAGAANLGMDAGRALNQTVNQAGEGVKAGLGELGKPLYQYLWSGGKEPSNLGIGAKGVRDNYLQAMFRNMIPGASISLETNQNLVPPAKSAPVLAKTNVIPSRLNQEINYNTNKSLTNPKQVDKNVKADSVDLNRPVYKYLWSVFKNMFSGANTGSETNQNLIPQAKPSPIIDKNNYMKYLKFDNLDIIPNPLGNIGDSYDTNVLQRGGITDFVPTNRPNFKSQISSLDKELSPDANTLKSSSTPKAYDKASKLKSLKSLDVSTLKEQLKNMSSDEILSLMEILPREQREELLRLIQ